MKSYQWKAALTAVLIIVALFYLTPTMFGAMDKPLPQVWDKYFFKDTINLGLDLKGGIHLIMRVMTEKAVEAKIDGLAARLQEDMEEKGLRFTDIKSLPGGILQVELVDQIEMDRLNDILNSDPLFTGLRSLKNYTTDRLIVAEFSLTDKEIRATKENAVLQTLETLRNRIDQFGVAEPTIQRQGPDRILVQLPGVTDPERVKKLLGRTARLEFKLVDNTMSINEALAGNIPEGYEIKEQKIIDPETGRMVVKEKYLLEKRILMTGGVISDARVSIDTTGFVQEPYVSIDMDSRGAKIFERVTGANVGRRLAIILDDNVYSAPTIREKIGGGKARIEGSFTMAEAKDLAIVLRAGALPAPVEIEHEIVVGPTLGRDSIRSGVISILIGGILVIVFMVFYYNKPGIIANIALLLNMLFIMAALAGFRATLTLPGIAGIILTVGMAVDANVLIFERIREELRLGKTPRAAIEGGYGKAFRTIIDANITTLIAALVLFEFGTGPVKGFAITLSIGILTSLFTAIIVTRSIFDYVLTVRKVKELKI